MQQQNDKSFSPLSVLEDEDCRIENIERIEIHSELIIKIVRIYSIF